ncbi:CsbD family protein [Kineococcus rubinsiae]|uniref:CsbD family protein n=1 Tax=Kineococcus rubinsiae TaxID=2609562 RepID=UPI001430C5FC|nr:CsbD family protein [Kineococcus rubinsiae]NIZ90132.1 CsbD family protein [Kineococcus rubinsiae]
MGLDDKIKNAAEKVTGQGKEKVGDATGDEQLKAEGQGDQAKGSLKQAGENVKDALR